MDIEKLEKLAKLKKSGAITKKEFEEQKKLILDADNNTSGNNKTFTCWHYFKECLTSKFFQFKGRAPLKEYWGFALFYTLFYILIMITEAGIKSQCDAESVITVANVVLWVIFFIPSLAVFVRRLHDAGFSAWWILTIIVPFLLVFFKSDKETNKYGPVPDGVNNHSENVIIIVALLLIFILPVLAFCSALMLSDYTVTTGNYTVITP